MEPPVLSDSLVLHTKEPFNSKSQFEWAKTLGLHAVAFVVVCIFSFILATSLGMRSGDGATMAMIGLSFGYFTVLACWTTFGQSTLRLILVPILLFCVYALQTFIFVLDSGTGLEFLPATTVASAAFFALMLSSSFILRWVSKIRVQHRSSSDEAYSERLRYGIGELLLATGVVALLITIGKTTSGDMDAVIFKRVITILTLLGLFHFILYWPVFLAALTRHRRILTIAGAVLVIAITIPAEVVIFSNFMDRGGMRGNANYEVYPILLFDLPFVLPIVLHLTIAYLLGHRLVMRKRESLQQAEPATESSTVFS